MRLLFFRKISFVFSGVFFILLMFILKNQTGRVSTFLYILLYSPFVMIPFLSLLFISKKFTFQMKCYLNKTAPNSSNYSFYSLTWSLNRSTHSFEKNITKKKFSNFAAVLRGSQRFWLSMCLLNNNHFVEDDYTF